MNEADEPRAGEQAAARDSERDTEPAGGAAADAGEPAPSDGRRGAGRGALIAVGALILAAGAAAVAGMLWAQYRALHAALEEADAGTGAVLERIEARLDGIEEEVAAAQAGSEAAARGLEALAGRVDEWPGRLADLERRIDAVQGGTAAARRRWLRAEAEYYLATANTALMLGDDWERAITALELADDRLRELADPALAPVRELIAEELLALGSVRLPDVDGLVFSLSRLAERVGDFPLRAAAPASFPAPEPVEDVEPGLGRLWAGLRNALAGLIRIERRDEPVADALSAAERSLVRRQVVLHLELAQIGLVRAEPGIYRGSLQAARSALERDFDARSPAVTGALERLADMVEIEIAPPKPDISRSLARLRATAAGGD